MRLKDKVVVVTGAGSGLGKSFAVTAATEGARVVLADINESAALSAAGEIERLGGKALACVVNVCDAGSVQSMINAAVEKFSRVDALVNSAGVFSSISFLDLTEQDWDKMLDVNVKGSFLCTQALIRRLLEQGEGGSILFLSSISGYIGFSKSAHYCASKGAVRQLSKAVALEFASYGIRSNVVAPGTIETPMNHWIFNDKAMRENSVSSIPMGRFGKPEEVIAAGIFLLSDEASFCTGSELLVDGGQITHC